MRTSSDHGAIARNLTMQLPSSCDSPSTAPQVPQKLPITGPSDLFDAASALCAISIAVAVLLHVISIRKRRAKAKHADLPRCTMAAIARKRAFLSRAGDAYGYRSCSSGFIDTWRPAEIPNLIAPVGTHVASEDESEVYLDYAGAALPTQTQLQKIMQSSCSILANPHSNGPAASRSLVLIEQAKKRVMDHFHCHPGRFAGLSNPPKACDPADCHAGYDIVWTSGATESLGIVAERFPWATCESCKNGSTLVYSQNSHTSVIGMRGPALSKGASFLCHSLSDICNANVETIERWGSVNHDQCSCCSLGGPVNNLLVLPLHCNFGGDYANVAGVIQSSREVSKEKSKWYTMLDLAKAASSDPIDLKALDPDFACISFYKLFGEPTGLGALFVKRSVTNVLMGQEGKKTDLDCYFGGGSVDAVLPRVNFAVARSGPTRLASLANGTVHFRGIASLLHGFDELDRVGGMSSICRHTRTLTVELARRLQAMRHGNGRPAIVMYGAWTNSDFDENVDRDHASLPGPTLPFNVLRDDGSFVGYNEVAKLAALNRPPLQLRTGCFCNPGACQEALQLTDEEVQQNYLTSHHVCGDHIDIINSKPTGGIRASFGKDSMWEDLDALVMFLDKNFVSKSMRQTMPTVISSVSEVALSELYIFPIKSCAAQRVARWTIHVDSGRFAFDREFALVDSSGIAMRLQMHPRMCLLQPRIDLLAKTMTVSAPGCNDLVLILDDDCPNSEVQDCIIKVCGNKCGGRLWGDYEASEWFSSFLGVQCWLARHYGDRYERPSALQKRSEPSNLRTPEIAFANEAPLLLLSDHSVETLNEVILSLGQRRVSSRHFRPNLVVRSKNSTRAVSISNRRQYSNPEDHWTTLSLVGTTLELKVVGQCARCSMVDVDPTTGTKGKTMRALADYRRRNGQITFGVFLHTEKKAETAETVWLQEGDILKCT